MTFDLSKENILKKIENNDCDFFYKVYNEMWGKTEVETLWEMNMGDGNDYMIALDMKESNLCVLLDGTYSSWDSPYWHRVTLGKEYEFKETRYRAVSLSDIRDKKIDDVLKEEGEEK